MTEKVQTISKRSWKVKVLFSFACLITVIALIYAVEDWRGKSEWEDFKRQWEAKGENFSWQAYAQPSVPADQNFFSAPIFTNIVNGQIEPSIYRDDGSSPKSSAYWAEGTVTDLRAWQAYYRAQDNQNSTNEFPVASQPQAPAADVLLALSKYDSDVEELRQASERPDANIPLNYEDGFGAVSTLLPYLSALKRCCSLLELRAVAELADGRNAEAYDDVKLLCRLNDTIRTQPFLISHLVRMAVLQITLQPIWEGWTEHRWTDEQLAGISAELAKLDFLADYQFAMRGERAFALQSFENRRITRMFRVIDDTGRTNTIHYYFMPEGFFYQNELAWAQMVQQRLLPLVDINDRIVSPGVYRDANDAVLRQLKHYSSTRVEASMTFQPEAGTVKRFAFAQSSVDLARVACALERYRLAHGGYPESLEALAPQFIQAIPHDIIDGKPLHYRRTDDGKCMLYSVGWNETDDGGLVPSTNNGGTIGKCDWVWRYPIR
ncbi:MAG TPA: hypothetical protein VMF08_23310 [Candidatus Sulfotelmatobacter sp.]|nr:hypothetical protein [Candidatus Sulfotelmatobacter sp.]